jgi:hypothetical protein
LRIKHRKGGDESRTPITIVPVRWIDSSEAAGVMAAANNKVADKIVRNIFQPLSRGISLIFSSSGSGLPNMPQALCKELAV